MTDPQRRRVKRGDTVYSGGTDDTTKPVRGTVLRVQRYGSNGHNVTEEIYVQWLLAREPDWEMTRER